MYMQDDVLTEPFDLRGCCVIPSKKPGLGIDVDRAKLRHYELN